MINIRELTEKDIGRKVKCNISKEIEDFGKIKTWDDNFIYVIYDGWAYCEGLISEPTHPKYLTFVTE